MMDVAAFSFFPGLLLSPSRRCSRHFSWSFLHRRCGQQPARQSAFAPHPNPLPAGGARGRAR